MPKSDQVAVDDPKMPFNARGTLGYGHTLRIHVYEGARNPDRIYNAVVMVNSEGMLDFDKMGQVRVGGAALPQAAAAIESTFRVNGQITKPLTVHIISVEDVPVVAITGDVLKEEFIPSWEGMSIAQAVRVAGGRKLGSSAHGVYLIRNGKKRYFTSLEAADKDEPEPGDIITLSPDI
jgi:protein involved in polysaccharide export with SLBB domain